MPHAARRSRPILSAQPVWLIAALAITLGGGCAWQSYLQPMNTPGPEIFSSLPSARQAVDAINANSNAIQELYAEGATVSVQGMPALKANLAIRKPRSMRMQASVLGIGGPALDVGSNDERFWFWTQQVGPARGAPQGVFFARHEDASRLPMHDLLPIEPHWLIEALGVVTIDPMAQVEGPLPDGPDQFLLRVREPNSDGLTRELTVHNRYGWVLKQKLLAADGRLLAEATATRHRYYPDYGVTLPEEVNLMLSPDQPNQMALRIFVGEYLVNRLLGDPEALFQMPQIEGQPPIDLTTLSGPGDGRPPQIAPSPAGLGAPRTGYRPEMRGFEVR